MIRWLRLWALVMCCGAVCVPPSHAQDLDVQVNPTQVVDGQVAQLIIATTKPIDLKNAVLSIEPPPGFKAEPQTIRYASGAQLREIATVQRVDVSLRSGKQTVLVRLRNDAGVIADRTIDIDFRNSTMTARGYLAVGLIGVVVGFCIKLGMKALSVVTPPIVGAQAARDRETAEHALVRFVREHYYTVDLLVTLLIGFLVLLASLTGVIPPAGTQWPTALVTGAGIGVLANNELVGRISRR